MISIYYYPVGMWETMRWNFAGEVIHISQGTHFWGDNLVNHVVVKAFTYIFETLEQVRIISVDWMNDYNHSRPHKAYGGKSPVQYRITNSIFPSLAPPPSKRERGNICF
ncbi:MAG: integrase core domain-containing protein [Flavobacteriales bacterium]